MSSMHIAFDKLSRYFQLATSRGLPEHLLRLTLDIDSTELEISQYGDNKPITSSTQFRKLERTFAKPTTGNYLLVISSMHEEKTSQLVAAGIFMKAVVQHTKHAATTPLPFIHPVYGGRYDRLRDDPSFKNMVSRLSLLVLTNIAANSTQDKIEKVRDLLAMHSNVPRILVVSGCDPLEFCLNNLYLKPTRVVWLGGPKKTKTITV